MSSLITWRRRPAHSTPRGYRRRQKSHLALKFFCLREFGQCRHGLRIALDQKPLGSLYPLIRRDDLSSNAPADIFKIALNQLIPYVEFRAISKELTKRLDDFILHI